MVAVPDPQTTPESPPRHRPVWPLALACSSVASGGASFAAITLFNSDMFLPVAIGALLTGVVSLVAAAVVMRRAGIVRTALTMGLACVGFGLGFFAPGQRRTCCGPMANAIGSIRAISSAQSTYAAACAGGGYAVDLVDLGTGPPGGSAFISPDLGYQGVIRHGYRFSLERDAAPGVVDVGTAGRTCNNARHQPASSFFASANPVDPQASPRYFATDASGTIYESTAGPIRNPITPGPTVKPIQ